jgi:hypothetical protein
MARRRGGDRKDHQHVKGVRCSKCRPLSKAEVAALEPPPPPAQPDQTLTPANIQRLAYMRNAR